jgi:xanthine dehydrogenase accessory factor
VAEELARLGIDERTYVVIVTRGHRHDAQALRAVIELPARYVGLIGSRRKIHAVLTELHQAGVAKEKLAKVNAPIGLEIGAVTPGEIAVSIAAELVAVRRGAQRESITSMRVPMAEVARWLATEPEA